MSAVREITDCSDNQAEYWTHVSSQAELPLADAAWRDRTLGQLDGFIDAVSRNADRDESSWQSAVADTLFDKPSSLSEFRLVAAISDKRLYLDLSYMFSRVIDPNDTSTTLCGCSPSNLTRHPTAFFERMLGKRVAGERRRAAANTIAQYLTDRGLDRVLDLYAGLGAEARLAVLLHWLMPKETQQNEAKRRGHGAEAAIARILQEVNCTILPTEKATNPMGAYDPNVSMETFEVVPRRPGATFSADIVLPRHDGRIAACVMGLVQSSDPGQFGVNKSDEVVGLRRLIDANNEKAAYPPLELWGLVDGVGYSENKAGTVNKMLESFHYNIQVKSAYKAGLRAHQLGLTEIRAIKFDMEFYSPTTRDQMIERYVPQEVEVLLNEPASDWRPVSAGAAVLWLDR